MGKVETVDQRLRIGDGFHRIAGAQARQLGDQGDRFDADLAEMRDADRPQPLG